MPKLRISTSHKSALTINREAFIEDNVVYIVLANRRIIYGNKASRIVYIGSTKKGGMRLTQSASERSAILREHGINSLSFYIVSCTGRKHVQTWKKLEKALVLKFKELHGSIPVLNDHFKNMDWDTQQLDKYFTHAIIRKTIIDYEKM